MIPCGWLTYRNIALASVNQNDFLSSNTYNYRLFSICHYLYIVYLLITANVTKDNQRK